MSDITTLWDNTLSQGDLAMAGADLLSGFDLMSALLISIYSDRLANADDEIPDGSTDRRGWWGDLFDPTHLIGSRLWLLSRAKLTPAVALQAQGYLAECLQWLIDDGVVAGFVITTEIKAPNQLNATIQAYRSLAGKAAKNYAWVWKGPIIYNPAVGGQGTSGYLVTETGIELVTEDGTVLTT